MLQKLMGSILPKLLKRIFALISAKLTGKYGGRIVPEIIFLIKSVKSKKTTFRDD